METHRLLGELRKQQQKSFADIAAPAELSRTAVHRAENPDSPLVRGATLDAILTKGYGLKDDHPWYKKIVAAWTRDRMKPLQKPAKRLEQKIASLTPAKRKALEKFLRDL